MCSTKCVHNMSTTPPSPLDLDKSHKYQQLPIFQIRLWLPLPFWKCLHLLHRSNTIWILNKYKPTIFQKCKKRMFFRLVVLRGCRGRYSSETPEDFYSLVFGNQRTFQTGDVWGCRNWLESEAHSLSPTHSLNLRQHCHRYPTYPYRARPSRLPCCYVCYVFVTTNKYKKYKSVELADQLTYPLIRCCF